jgi:hypothetical protein
MTINKLAANICRIEGKKSQARMGDVKELLGILSDAFYESYKHKDPWVSFDFIMMFINNGAKRAKKRKKE